MIGTETMVIMIPETEETVTSMIVETEIKEIENTVVVVADNKKEGQEAVVVMVIIIQVLGKKLIHRHVIIIDPHRHEIPHWQVTRLYQMVVVVTVEEDVSIVEVGCLVVDGEMTDGSLKADIWVSILEQKL